MLNGKGNLCKTQTFTNGSLVQFNVYQHLIGF